ncbi:hypothetical protein OnM2_027078 [Erysiphe neolycopersici]|uniref:SGNH hydrolase-type esterase domain-containing protein n=1 Tax=Erysiphe neolycopersici TaxID=212602 RepID=A0A420I0J6_9PEZI|nr:hypothetical protein OnM2_027078 [Erysiphe neolycopersici]
MILDHHMMRHQFKKILLAVVLAILTLSFYFASPTSSMILPTPHIHAIEAPTHSSLEISLPKLRILPLGDSLTYGYLSSNGDGYRAHLRDILNVTYPSVTYVGTQTSGNMTNNVHEGHPGYMIHDIAKKALPSLVQQPNLILVMAGTNDIARPYMPDDAPWRLGALIDFVLLSCPFSVVIVAQLAPITVPPEGENMIKIFNSQVPEIVATRQRAGKKVLLVDMSQRFTVAHLQDGVHPSDKGYELIAQTWYDGIQQAVRFGWIWEPISVGHKGRLTGVKGPDGTEVPLRPVIEDGRICEICI